MSEPVVATNAGPEPVTLTMAHPLTVEQAARLGLPQAVSMLDEVRVNRDTARAIISSGYATVDPERREAVNEVLGGNRTLAVEAPLDTQDAAAVERALDLASFDPADNNVAQVNAYLAQASDAERERVLVAERAREDGPRSSIHGI